MSEEFNEQLIQYFFLLTENELKARYSTNLARKIFDKFKQSFKTFILKYHGNMDLKFQSINPVFLMSLNDAQDVEQNELLDQMLFIYRIMLKDILNSQKEEYSELSDPWKKFVESTKRGNKHLYENEFFKCDTVIDTEESYGFNLNRCIYVEIFKENKNEKLAPLLCHYDYILSNNLSKWVKFERDETIAHGFKACLFRFQRNRI